MLESYISEPYRKFSILYFTGAQATHSTLHIPNIDFPASVTFDRKATRK